MRNRTDLEAEPDRSRENRLREQRNITEGEPQRANGSGALRGELHRGCGYRNRALMPYSRLRCPGEGRADRAHP